MKYTIDKKKRLHVWVGRADIISIYSKQLEKKLHAKLNRFCWKLERQLVDFYYWKICVKLQFIEYTTKKK